MLISLTKNESIFFASFLFILSCFSLMKEKKFTYIIGFVPGGSLVLLWFIFRFFNLPPPPYYIIGNGNIGSTLQISLAMVRELANLQRWNLAWIFIIAALVYPKIKKSLRLVLLVCVFQLVAFVFAYFASPLNPVDHVNTSFDRLLLQLYPCFFYLASVNFMSIHQPRSRLQ